MMNKAVPEERLSSSDASDGAPAEERPTTACVAGERQEIAELVARYAYAVDVHDVAATVACFTEDTHVDFEGGKESVDGRDGLARFFDDAFSSPRIGPTGVSTHLMSNIVVTLDGDTAHVETQAVAYHANDERDTVMVRGLRYSDDCIRTDGGWLIRHRIHRSLWEYEAPGGPTHPF